MYGFVDEAVIEVASGDGGKGSVHFRREKYVPKGGPDGGDGGKGGDVVFIVKKNLKTLSHIRLKHTFKAENGQPGMGRKKHGRDGRDVEIAVPPGTLIRQFDTDTVLHDLKDDGRRWVFLKGGKGGLGNTHFTTSRKQAPRYAQPGLPGGQMKLKLELRIIADIGLVGFPNAGKSTLLKVLSNANPEIGDYPFTTKIPNLGVLRLQYRDILIADIPGIIKDASKGAGLGFQFLKHIARTSGLAFLLDCSDPEAETHFDTLFSELSSYSKELAGKPRVLVGTKLDAEGAQECLRKIEKKYPDEQVIGISALIHKNLDQLKNAFALMAEQ